MDGDLGKYDELGVRLQAADTVLVLDFSLLRCLLRALRRSKARMDSWWWLVTWRCIECPKIKKAITEHAAVGHSASPKSWSGICPPSTRRAPAKARPAKPNDMHRRQPAVRLRPSSPMVP